MTSLAAPGAAMGLVGERVFLRSLEIEDLPRIHAWQNDAETCDWLSAAFRPRSTRTIEQWLRAKQEWSEHELNFAICISATAEHIGNIYLRDLEWVDRRGELHIYIGQKTHRGLGYGEDAVRTVARYAFTALGMHRVFLFVANDNLPAIRMYERCGFRREGVLAEHYFKHGGYRDVLVMGLVASRMPSAHAAAEGGQLRAHQTSPIPGEERK
jgi:RimJ/RimL family protein N-acetyltransferase